MMRTLKRILALVRSRTLLEALRYRMDSTGIVLAPYYLFLEKTDWPPPPEFLARMREYTFSFLRAEDMDAVQDTVTWKSSAEEWRKKLCEGKRCFAARYRGELVSLTWIALDRCDTEWGRFPLKDNEAYLFATCTKEAFRGRQIASYLRYQTYLALRSLGRDRCYSYSSVFNKSSIKFKLRMDARIIKLGVYISLFGRWEWNVTVRDEGRESRQNDDH